MKRAIVAGLTAYAAYYAFLKTPTETLPLIVGRKRCCFITGAASGIGLATAKLLISEGWFIGAFDLNLEGLKRAFADCPDEVVFCGYMDVTSKSSCEEALNAFLKRTDGNMDVLFNCAGLFAVGEFAEMPLEKQLAQLHVNCTGLTQLSYLALPALKRTKDSRIINMASLAAAGGCGKCAVYAATKAYVYSFTEGLRSELAKYRIRIADISVGFVDTPMVQMQDLTQLSSVARKSIEQKLISRPEDVAEKVYQAIRQCDVYNEHFYVREALLLFKLTFLGRLLGIPLHAKITKSFVSNY